MIFTRFRYYIIFLSLFHFTILWQTISHDSLVDVQSERSRNWPPLDTRFRFCSTFGPRLCFAYILKFIHTEAKHAKAPRRVQCMAKVLPEGFFYSRKPFVLRPNPSRSVRDLIELPNAALSIHFRSHWLKDSTRVSTLKCFTSSTERENCNECRARLIGERRTQTTFLLLIFKLESNGRHAVRSFSEGYTRERLVRVKN